MSGWSSSMPDLVADLEVAQGEVDNILSAALRDLAYSVKKGVEDNWPIDTGESLAGWRVERNDETSYELVNRVDYTSYVWSDRVKPSLADRLVEQSVSAVQSDVEAFLSDRILELLDTER